MALPNRHGISDVYAEALQKIHRLFEPTNLWDRPGSLPHPSDLRVGHNASLGVVEIIFRDAEGDEFPVASTGTHVRDTKEKVNVAEAQELGKAWLTVYRWYNYNIQAELVGWDNPYKMTQPQVDAIILKNHAPYATKVKMATTGVAGVETGASESGRTRTNWYGHSGFSLARWMGANGWTGAEAIAVYEHLGITFGRSAITGGVYAGRKGERGAPAPVSPAQAKILKDARTITEAKQKVATANGSTVPPAAPKAPPKVVMPTPPTTPVVKKSKNELKMDKEFKAMSARTAAKRNERPTTKRKGK